MQTFKSWKSSSNTGSGLLKGIKELVIGIWRCFGTSQLIRKGQSQPSDNTLCYRGIRVSPSVLKPAVYRKGANRRVDDALCYRGVHISSAVSKLTATHESQNRPVNDTLCYRGVRYNKMHASSCV
jgi:hypothetical protein